MTRFYETRIELVGEPWSQRLPARVMRGTINQLSFTEYTNLKERNRFFRHGMSLQRTDDDAGTVALRFWMWPRYSLERLRQYQHQVNMSSRPVFAELLPRMERDIKDMRRAYFPEALAAIDASIARYVLGASRKEAKHVYEAPIYQPDGLWELIPPDTIDQRIIDERGTWESGARRVIPKNTLTLPDLAYYIAHAPTWPPKDGHLEITDEP